MYTERLLLEVEASRVGWNVIKPSSATGRSGTTHVFSFLASSENMLYGFDVYDRVTEIEVLKSYIKAYDAKASVQIVSPVNAATEGAKRLAREYGMSILAGDDVHSFFQNFVLKREASAEGRMKLTA